MNKYIWCLSIVLIISGCANTGFYNNSTINAHSAVQSITIERLERDNPFFDVYKIDSKNYALGYAKKAPLNIIKAVNESIILDDLQLKNLKHVCEKIIDSYRLDMVGTANKVDIIEYHLTLKDSKTYYSSETNLLANAKETEVKVESHNQVIFRIQFENTLETRFDSGKKIIFMYGNKFGEMDVEDVSALLSDLNK